MVGTGLEEKVARDSGAVVIARRAGIVTRVTADEIIIDAGVDGAQDGRHARWRVSTSTTVTGCRKYWRTNQDTAINQRPAGAGRASRSRRARSSPTAPATENGELALGSNVTVAFMPWYGHNFEDAIVLSERLVKDDVYSSIHIQELELHVRDTKRGQEEITREIPNVSEESLVDLDERGIVRIGAHVKPGDILVGKITPKGETELSPEEKLLTAIFGEKAKDVKDSSLKVPPGMEGVVIDVKIFSRVEDQVVEKDRGERIGEVRRVEGEEKVRVNEGRDRGARRTCSTARRWRSMLKAGTVEEYRFRPARSSRRRSLDEIDLATVDLKTLRVESEGCQRAHPRHHRRRRRRERARIEEKAEERIDRILQPDELPPGVIQLVKVYLRREAEDLGGRQDGRPPRQQGYRGAHRSRGGHAVPPGRHARSTSCSTRSACRAA